MRTYIVRAKLKHNKKIYRDLEVLENISLYDLADEILNSFDFDFDHLFGFGDNPNSFYNSKIKYGIKDEQDDFFDDAFGRKKDGDVEETTLSEVDFLRTEKDKMSFLFDFGDNWKFEIELRGFGEKERRIKYPRILKINGEAPEQYPECD